MVWNATASGTSRNNAAALNVSSQPRVRESRPMSSPIGAMPTRTNTTVAASTIETKLVRNRSIAPDAPA